MDEKSVTEQLCDNAEKLLELSKEGKKLTPWQALKLYFLKRKIQSIRRKVL